MKTTLLFLSVFLSTSLFGQFTTAQPLCDEVDGLEFDSIISVEDGYTGFAYRCNGDKVEYLEKYVNGDVQMSKLWYVGRYELGEQDTLSYLMHMVFKNDKIAVKTYNEFGILRDEYNWLNKKNEKGLWINEGVQRTFDVNGQLKYEDNYKNDKRNGLDEQYYENGKLMMQTNYIKGKIEGTRKSYRKDGQLWEESNFRKGLYHGKHTTYFENSQIKYETVWKKNKRHGIMRDYYENGGLYREILWKKGKKIKYSCWDEYGQLIECNLRGVRFLDPCFDEEGNVRPCYDWEIPE
ncbi:toxin-antitoxin system YwqK family antitoxin [Crocinitomicaceae bacterium]|jgi:antitoxin component YwqK of YwqJK toxin-antitoxin module|nr:toxin-antitoxin system YwqK family antitoxin [Crocinitomicaceae bacterium]